MPLALPLVLLVPGARGQSPGAQGDRSVQELVLDEVIAPPPEHPSTPIPSSQLQSDRSEPEVYEGRKA